MATTEALKGTFQSEPERPVYYLYTSGSKSPIKAPGSFTATPSPHKTIEKSEKKTNIV